MKLSEREWTVLQALWETGGAELGVVVQLLHHGADLFDPHGGKGSCVH